MCGPQPAELEKVGKVAGCVNMPLSSLRQALGTLQDKDKKYYVYCQVRRANVRAVGDLPCTEVRLYGMR